MGGLRAVVISAYDTLLTYTALFKDGARKHKRRLKEEYSMNKTFSAEYDFLCVRQLQIACTDRFARVLMHVRAIARVKQKGLV